MPCFLYTLPRELTGSMIRSLRKRSDASKERLATWQPFCLWILRFTPRELHVYSKGGGAAG